MPSVSDGTDPHASIVRVVRAVIKQCVEWFLAILMAIIILGTFGTVANAVIEYFWGPIPSGYWQYSTNGLAEPEIHSLSGYPSHHKVRVPTWTS